MAENKYSDKLEIFVKKNKVDAIVDSYKLLGWVEEKRIDNDYYDDIVDISFTRPHNIQNKDELQLLQVYMEDKINAVAKLEKHRYSLITTLALTYGFLSLAMIVLGILCCFHIFDYVGIIFGTILFVVATFLIVFGIVTLPKLHKREKAKFESRHKLLMKEIFTIAKQASKLSGVDYGQD